MYEFVIYSETFKLSGRHVSDYLSELLESLKWDSKKEVGLGWQLHDDGDNETHYIMLTALNDIVTHFINDLKLPISISTGPETDEPIAHFEEWYPYDYEEEEAMMKGYISTPKDYCDAGFINNPLGAWRQWPPVI